MTEVDVGDPVAISDGVVEAPSEKLENTPDLTVIIVSYNTKDLTLKCLETLYSETFNTRFSTIVYDNASKDGSAEAIAERFPDVKLIAARENIGFARANNVAAEMADTEWLLLLNPDTEVHSGAIDALLAFSRATPEAGITGGRTVFPDGSLNLASCWMRMTPWSLFCSGVGLSAMFPNSEFFNPEAIGGWKRDSVREVDIVVGCFLMIRRALWKTLGGFDLRYFMYGEEADLCLRARALGYRPAITPEAEIMHLVGASSGRVADQDRACRQGPRNADARPLAICPSACWESLSLALGIQPSDRRAASRVDGATTLSRPCRELARGLGTTS